MQNKMNLRDGVPFLYGKTPKATMFPASSIKEKVCTDNNSNNE